MATKTSRVRTRTTVAASTKRAAGKTAAAATQVAGKARQAASAAAALTEKATQAGLLVLPATSLGSSPRPAATPWPSTL